MRIPHNHQPAPDIVFFRNTGIALTTLAMAAGFISVIGSLGAGEPSMQIKSASDLVQSTELIMRQTDPNVSRREAFQAGYVNPEGSTQ